MSFELPAPIPLPLPEGASEEQLREFLRSVWVTDASPEEMLAYGEQDFKRFVYTYGLAKDLQGKCLELGANPYFTTMLLKQFTNLELVLANYFGPTVQGAKVTQEVKYRDFVSGQESLVCFESHHFNTENDPFPFESSSFDVVVFCEIIEHLLMDPAAVLREIKRVLKPNGKLILSTPNVARLENVLRLAVGANIYDPYSGHGPYGRHNREYTKHELFSLLDYLGFTLEILFSADVHAGIPEEIEIPEPIQAALLSNPMRLFDLGEYIFIRAVSDRPAREKKPDFLYRSYPPEQLETTP